MGPNRLKELREAKGLSLSALAACVGTSNQQISLLELGKRQLTVAWLGRLGAALGCRPWDIVAAPEASDPRELALLQSFRALRREDQEALLAELAARTPKSPSR